MKSQRKESVLILVAEMSLEEWDGGGHSNELEGLRSQRLPCEVPAFERGGSGLRAQDLKVEKMLMEMGLWRLGRIRRTVLD